MIDLKLLHPTPSESFAQATLHMATHQATPTVHRPSVPTTTNGTSTLDAAVQELRFQNARNFMSNGDGAAREDRQGAATDPVTFQTTMTGPTPPPSTPVPSAARSHLAPLDTTTKELPGYQQSALSAGLRIQTDLVPGCTVTSATASNVTGARSSGESPPRPSRANGSDIKRTPSVKHALLSSSVGSNSGYMSTPNSALSSPIFNSMADVTPLPSPLLSADSPGPWKILAAGRPVSRDNMVPPILDSALAAANGEGIFPALANQSKRRAYNGLGINSPGEPSSLINVQINREKNAEGHTRNRSVSEYVPEPNQMTKPRKVTVSSSHSVVPETTSVMQQPESQIEPHMRREPHLAVQRGLGPIPRPPTPPLSRTGGESSDSDSSLNTTPSQRAVKKPRYEYFDAHTRNDLKLRRWRALKPLGQGTFSRVILATSQIPDDDARISEDDVFVDGNADSVAPETRIDRKKLVAIKICEHGPKGGASEERVEMSLKRELEIMKTIHHPSLVDLKAWNVEESRAILVLSYCPGGDLFEVASERRDLLIPALLRRIMAELVGAVQYLHERHIVHRDIKLESTYKRRLAHNK